MLLKCIDVYSIRVSLHECIESNRYKFALNNFICSGLIENLYVGALRCTILFVVD